MPPRKSLPATSSVIHRPTPKRGQSSTPRAMDSAPRKRQRRTEIEDDLESLEAEPHAPITRQSNGIVAVKVAAGTANGSEILDPEKELEHWQDFAVEHYEMVEQLPLELHRNYRLLRELDDGVAVHAEKLQTAIRNYIAFRLGDSAKSAEVVETTSSALIPPLPSLTLEGGAGPVDADGKGLTSVLDMGIPESDGHGGQVMPAPALESETAAGQVIVETVLDDGEDAVEETTEEGQAVQEDKGRRLFPSVSPSRPEADALPPQAIKQDSLEVDTVAEKRNQGWKLLPEIARLAKEMVKNGEEKVAVAQGAYNSIDRHIRALDSALSSQEASILLGLRPDTLPSAAVGNGLDTGETGAKGEEDTGTIGTGGGGVRRKGRAARGRARAGARNGEKASQAIAQPSMVPEPPVIIDADPNEPRYCYCNQVSFGEMIGCDNDDCPIEWVHLVCAGLAAAPAGKWLCDICDPNSARNKAEKATGAAKGAARGTGRGTRGKARGRQTR